MNSFQGLNIDQLEDKAGQFLDPAFFGGYSFEYAYRLLLVYLSTNKTMIRSLKAEQPNIFDEAFLLDLQKGIEGICRQRGVVINEDLASSLSKSANDSLVYFIKSPMKDNPSKLARNVCELLDKMTQQALGDGKKAVIPHIFIEEEE